MKRLMLIVLGLVVFSVFIAISTDKKDEYTIEFYGPLMKQPLDTIVGKGIDYVYAGEPDSAMIYFGVVAGRYNESMSKSDKIACARAFNSKGYVEFFEQGHFRTSLFSLIKAEQIEEEAEDSTYLPLIYLNMANVLTYSNDIDNVILMFRKSTDYALMSRSWRTYLMAFNNLVFQAIMERDVSLVSEDLKRFATLRIPDANMRGFAQSLYDGSVALLDKDWDKAYAHFLKADSVNNSELTPERSHAMSVFLRCRTLELEGNKRQAISELQENLKSFTDDQISSAYLYMSRLYQAIDDTSNSQKYKLTYYEMADSLGILSSSDQIESVYSQSRIEKMSEEITRLDARRNAWITTTIVCALCAIILAIALFIVIKSMLKLRRSQDELYHKNAIINESTVNSVDPEFSDEGQRIYQILANSKEIYEVGFSIEKAAILTGLHSRRISKVLNAAFQKNFNTIIQELRIKEACRLLSSATSGSLNMSGIATNLGFKSRTYFSEVFKKQTGLTPSEYMKSAKRVNR